MKTIALAMIARNEERCLERCLRSAEPYVDRLIVLDTGSTDRTIEIARDCGAEVFERRWTDDFAAARNAVLSRSSADYNLILDADEWIEEGGEHIAGLREQRQPKVYLLKVRSTLQQHTSDIQSFNWLMRLLPRGVRYRGRVHEQPHHRLPTERLDVTLGHDGYTPQLLKAKRGRNRALLLQQLAENPEDAYVLYQLGKDDDVYTGAESAVTYYWKALELANPRASYRHDLIMRLLVCLPMIGQSDKALMLGVDPGQVYSALGTYLASTYVNDFNFLGRTFRVTAQAEPSAGAQRKSRDTYRETTLEDIESSKMPVAQKVVIALAVLGIIAFAVWYMLR